MTFKTNDLSMKHDLFLFVVASYDVVQLYNFHTKSGGITGLQGML